MKALNYPGWYVAAALVLIGKAWSLVLAVFVALETLRQVLTD